MSCDISSDEQRDSHRFDCLDLQNMRQKASLDAFSPGTVEQLNRRARTLVKRYAAAITAIADRLLVCQTLDQTDVENLVKENRVGEYVKTVPSPFVGFCGLIRLSLGVAGVKCPPRITVYNRIRGRTATWRGPLPRHALLSWPRSTRR